MMREDALDHVEADILAEAARAKAKHGEQVYLPDLIWAAIANEEGGEALKEALSGARFGTLYPEVIQAATMFREWAVNLWMRGTIPWHNGFDPSENTQGNNDKPELIHAVMGDVEINYEESWPVTCKTHGLLSIESTSDDAQKRAEHHLDLNAECED